MADVDIIRKMGCGATGYTELADDIYDLLKREYAGRFQIIVRQNELEVIELEGEAPPNGLGANVKGDK